MALLFLFPSVREQLPEGLRRCSVWHFGAAVEHVGEVFEEVDPVQPAGAGQGVEDASALGTGPLVRGWYSDSCKMSGSKPPF